MTEIERERLEHMVDFARRATVFLGAADFDRYIDDEKTQAAVERCVEIVGEAAGKISAGVVGRLRYADWGKIIGTRHILAHGYSSIDHRIIFDIVTLRLPALIAAIERLLAEEPE